jgi:hypothetical protein
VTDLAIGLELPSLSFPMIDNEVCSCGVSGLEVVEVEVQVRLRVRWLPSAMTDKAGKSDAAVGKSRAKANR